MSSGYDSTAAIIAGNSYSTTKTVFETSIAGANYTPDVTPEEDAEGGVGLEFMDFMEVEGLIDPWTAVHVYFGVACFHVIFAVIIWLVPCESGVLMEYKQPADTLYWWTFFSGFLAFVVAWGPVILLYPFIFIDTVEAKNAFLVVCMISIDGPFFGNFFPLIFAWICYFTGYTISTGWFISNDPLTQAFFWLGTLGMLLWTVGSIFFQLYFIPAIKIWFTQEKSRLGVEEELANIASQFNETDWGSDWEPDYTTVNETEPDGTFDEFGNPNWSDEFWALRKDEFWAVANDLNPL